MLDWRLKENMQLKEWIWNEICEGFTVGTDKKANCLKRVGEAARLFYHELYNDHLKDTIKEPSPFKRPKSALKLFSNITEED